MICLHENTEMLETGYLNEDEDETAYYCPDCKKYLIYDSNGYITWESEY